MMKNNYYIINIRVHGVTMSLHCDKIQYRSFDYEGGILPVLYLYLGDKIISNINLAEQKLNKVFSANSLILYELVGREK